MGENGSEADVSLPETDKGRKKLSPQDDKTGNRNDAIADVDAYARRDITGITFAANPARLKPRRKRSNVSAEAFRPFSPRDLCTELYQLNVQLFPLTKSPKKKKRDLK